MKAHAHWSHRGMSAVVAGATSDTVPVSTVPYIDSAHSHNHPAAPAGRPGRRVTPRTTTNPGGHESNGPTAHRGRPTRDPVRVELAIGRVRQLDGTITRQPVRTPRLIIPSDAVGRLSLNAATGATR